MGSIEWECGSLTIRFKGPEDRGTEKTGGTTKTGGPNTTSLAMTSESAWLIGEG